MFRRGRHGSAAARFITLCAREPDDSSVADRRRAAAAIGDWDAVADLAEEHRVSAFVWEACRDLPVQLSSSAEARLRKAAFSAATRALSLEVELRRLLGAARVPVMVLKGPAIARTLYRAPGLRPYGDLDIAVREDDEEQIVSQLLADGFSEAPYDAEVDRREHAAHVHEAAAFHRMFVARGGHVVVELHADILQLGLRLRSEGERWRRAIPVRGFEPALTLGAEDELVYLCVHAHKHGFNRLIWLKDIDLIVRRRGGTLNWRLIEDIARGDGTLSCVWSALRLARASLGTPVPPALLSRFAPMLLVRALHQLLWPSDRIVGLEGRMRRRSVQFLPAESWLGVLPNIVLMGKRPTRVRGFARFLFGRTTRGHAQDLRSPALKRSR